MTNKELLEYMTSARLDFKRYCESGRNADFRKALAKLDNAIEKAGDHKVSCLQEYGPLK